MSKMMNIDLVVSALALLACEEEIRTSGRTQPPPLMPTVYSMHPRSGNAGNRMVLIGQNFPVYGVAPGQPAIPEQYEPPGPLFSAFVGKESAEIVSVSQDAIIIEVPPLLLPGNYPVSLYINGYMVTNENVFSVTKPTL